MRLPKPTSRVAVTAAALALAAAPAAMAATGPNTSYTKKGAWSFVSAPSLHPPKLHADAPTARQGLAKGDFLLSNFENITLGKPFTGQGGPLIVDSHLNPVWFLPVANAYANNLREQTFNGKPALSWWQGTVTNTGATTQGTDYVVNQQYLQAAKPLSAASGWVITQHEMIIQGHDAWVTANSVPESLPAADRPAGVSAGQQVVDSAVQEYDLTTGKLLYSWSALAHVPLTQSQAHPNPAVPWDAYHVNSIQLVRGGAEFLVSLRNTWGAYLVDKATGAIQWTLLGNNGTGSSFTLPKGADFEWQHDVELHPLKSGEYLTVFDDACCGIVGPGKFGPPTGPTRGLLLKIDPTKHTVAYVHQYVHPRVAGNVVETAFQGNVQLLSNGNVVIGWGSAPFFSEFSYSGKLLFDAVMPSPDVSYRAYLFNWVGKPALRFMRQVVKTVKGRTTVYASWDGATQIASWRVLGGADAKHLRTVATARKTSFETALRLAKAYKVYKVQALDSRGHVLGTSSAFGAGTKSSGGGGFYGGY
jgi:hypothetical protein